MIPLPFIEKTKREHLGRFDASQSPDAVLTSILDDVEQATSLVSHDQLGVRTNLSAIA